MATPHKVNSRSPFDVDWEFEVVDRSYSRSEGRFALSLENMMFVSMTQRTGKRYRGPAVLRHLNRSILSDLPVLTALEVHPQTDGI